MLRYCIAGRHVVHDGVYCELCLGPLSFDGRRCMAGKCKSLSGKYAVTCSSCGSDELTGYAPSMKLGAVVSIAAWGLAVLIIWVLDLSARKFAQDLSDGVQAWLPNLLCPVLCTNKRVVAQTLILYALSFMLGDTGRKLRAGAALAVRTLWAWAIASVGFGARAVALVVRAVVRLVLSR